MAELSPGERAGNWIKVLTGLVAILVSLLGITNKDRIASWVAPGDVVATETTSNDQMDKINNKFKELDEEIKTLKTQDSTDQTNMQSQINAIRKLVN